MEAIKRHADKMELQYGITIVRYRPKKNIVQATREYGQPFVSKIMSAGLEAYRIKIFLYQFMRKRYLGCEITIDFLCCCNSKGEPRSDIQLVINSSKYMLDFITDNPIAFKVSNKCCDYCKKQLAHGVQKSYDMVITGERRDEGGMCSRS